jgi:CHAT domain-containing protein
VERGLEGKRHLLIVPDDALHLLPFQVLLTAPPGTNAREIPYLIRRHSITYAPSAGIFETLSGRSPTAPPRLIAFAPVHFGAVPSRETSLPGTLAEVDAIARLFPEGEATVHRFGEATKHAVLSTRFEEFGYVHFATHGYADDSDPDGAFIVLHGADGDDTLRPAEISRLELNGALVVLSACETAVGKVAAGDGVLGLVRAFVCANAQAVCASLWKVADDATARLMLRMYEHLRQGASNADALRRAQIDLMGDPSFEAPHLWGAFIMAGSGPRQRADAGA